MAGQMSVIEMLDAWGEWERCGSNVLRHLQSKSSLGAWLDSVTTTHRGFAPSMSDDDALLFGRTMLVLKNSRPDLYRVLFMVHVDKESMRAVASRINMSWERAAKLYERGIGVLDGGFIFMQAA
jgi:hypothetical protein